MYSPYNILLLQVFHSQPQWKNPKRSSAVITLVERLSPNLQVKSWLFIGCEDCLFFYRMCTGRSFCISNCFDLGTEILNNAIESLYSRIPAEKWIFVDVAIAPSTLTITEHGVNSLNLQSNIWNFTS